MKPKNLKKIISRFPRAKVLVVGDLILDEYIWGNVERISPEAPVPVVWANKKTYVPGGAANVATNISSLDAKVSLIGVVGRDDHKDILFAELKKRRIPVKDILIESGRYTTLKTRIIAAHQQVVRIDWEHTDSLSTQLNRKIVRLVEKSLRDFDALVIEDYGKGVINEKLLVQLIELAGAHKKIITVDPKQEHFRYYHGATAITPNCKELENAIRNLRIKDTSNRFKFNTDQLVTDKDIAQAADEIMRYLDLGALLVTLGEQGMRLFEKDGRTTHIPTVAQEVFDVSGAGDTVISAFTLGLASGSSLQEAAHLANFAAGIVVGKIGTATTTRKELLERIFTK